MVFGLHSGESEPLYGLFFVLEGHVARFAQTIGTDRGRGRAMKPSRGFGTEGKAISEHS